MVCKMVCCRRMLYPSLLHHSICLSSAPYLYCVVLHSLSVLCCPPLTICTVLSSTHHLYCVVLRSLSVLCCPPLTICTVSFSTHHLYCVVLHSLSVLCRSPLPNCTVSLSTPYLYCVVLHSLCIHSACSFVCSIIKEETGDGTILMCWKRK